MNQEKIGKFIMNARKNKGLTQSELASILGVTDRSVSNWENGKCMPDISLFKPLCEELGISVNDLLNGEEYTSGSGVDILSYSNNLINSKDKLNAALFLVVGIGIMFTIYAVIPPYRNSLIYIIISLIILMFGISKFTKSFKHNRIINVSFALLIIVLLNLLDFVNVNYNNEVPRLRLVSVDEVSQIYYRTPFFSAYNCNGKKMHVSLKISKDEKFCSMVRENEFNEYLKLLSNADNIFLGKRVNRISDSMIEVTSVNRGYDRYELYKSVSDKEEIKNIVSLLKKAKYADYVNDIGYPYLFQVSNNANLIGEFRLNYLYTEKGEYGLYFDEETMKELVNLFN